MLHVALFVELLRSHPRAMVWWAALTQALLWWLIPMAFYSAPPGDLPLAIAVGHEFNLGSYWGPPLAFWLADIVFVVAGMPGVYLLAQACVVAAYWAVFRLGEAIVGLQHAAIAVLLMIGISAFSQPTPSFGPSVLAMPLTAFALLHYWRAIGEGRRGYWFVLGADLGLLILTTHAGLILLAGIVAYTLANRRGRAMLLTVEPWVGMVILVVILFPHLLWIDMSGMGAVWLDRLRAGQTGMNPFAAGARQITSLALTHAGALVLVAVAFGWGAREKEKAPTFQRNPITTFERRFVLSFAIGLPLASTLIGAIMRESTPVGGMSPNIVLSGLAIVVLAGSTIEVHRQWLTGLAWTILLLAPPLFAAVALLVLPFVTTTTLVTAQPSKEIGQFFGERFERRTGKRLPIVAGDPRLASLVALRAAGRPSLFLDSAPERTPWVTAEDMRRKGGVVVWLATDTVGTPPAEIRERFPDLVPELPRAFEFAIQGRMPLLRIGWGVVRPQ